METVLDKILNAFSPAYILTVIIASYFVIKLVDYLNGEAEVKTWHKRIATFGVGVLAFAAFYIWGNTDFEVLVASYFAALFFYDVVIKFLLKKLEIEYK